jgi:hypothetical protein
VNAGSLTLAHGVTPRNVSPVDIVLSTHSKTFSDLEIVTRVDWHLLAHQKHPVDLAYLRGRKIPDVHKNPVQALIFKDGLRIILATSLIILFVFAGEFVFASSAVEFVANPPHHIILGFSCISRSPTSC